MDCPVCQTSPLTPHTDASHLESADCARCGGRWISMERYQTWRQQLAVDLPEVAVSDLELTLHSADADSPAKRCTECGAILVPYKVGHEIPFRIDRCGHCGGMWFDKNEWEILKSRNLHEDVHQVFTQAWQRSVAQAERAKLHEQNLLHRFGPDDYAHIREVKSWLDAHHLRSALLAYLAE